MKKKGKKNAAMSGKVVDLELVVKQNFNQIMVEGNDFGNVLIKTVSLVLTDYKGFGVAVVGLTKAVLVLHDLAALHGIDFESLYDCIFNQLKERYQEESL